jgi:hypothetical protein
MHLSKEKLQNLKQSVCSDIYYGYIRETLAHLSPCSVSEVIAIRSVNAHETYSLSNVFFGHEVGNTLDRGFFLQNSSVIPQGFKAASCPCNIDVDFVPLFVTLLRDKKFCCSRCTAAFSSQGLNRSSKFIPAAIRQGQSFRSFGFQNGTQFGAVDVFFSADRSSQVNDAVFCLAMLNHFFDLRTIDIVDDSILYSVQQDVHDGYISKTLSYLVG